MAEEFHVIPSTSADPVAPKAGATPSVASPTGSPPSAIEQHLQDTERHVRAQEDAKRAMENQILTLQMQLKEEHEKFILLSLKAKEEEALSVKVEQQLHEMQERLRREKYEQELHDSRGKAENQIKDLERRIADERETWMAALKNQLKEREAVERDVEQNLTHRIQELERRYQADKNDWGLALRQKEEEANQARRQFQIEMETLHERLEEKEEEMKDSKERAVQERRGIELQAQAEMRALQAQMDTQLREAGTWKAQQALVQTRLHQVEAHHEEERAHWQAQLDRLETEHADMRKRLELQMTAREEDLKREFLRRDQERAQYWEGILSQTRSEKEALRKTLFQREEDLAKVQIALAETQRDFEVERSRWEADLEKVKRLAREEALRDIPGSLKNLLETERKKWEEDHIAVIDDLKIKLNNAFEVQNALKTKLDIEMTRAQQEQASVIEFHEKQRKDFEAREADLKSELTKALEASKALEQQRETAQREWEQKESRSEKQQWEKQTKEFLHHIAAAQMKEAAVREEMEKLTQEWQTQQAHWKTEEERLRADLTAAQRELANVPATKPEDVERLQKTIEELQLQQEELKGEAERWKELSKELSAQETKWKAKEEEWRSAQTRLKEAFHHGESEILKLQNERLKRDTEWTQKEAEWLRLKAELEKRVAAGANPPQASGPVPAASPIPAEAQKAIASIREELQQMQAFLAWLRPADK